jgi:hypothetical protein
VAGEQENRRVMVMKLNPFFKNTIKNMVSKPAEKDALLLVQVECNELGIVHATIRGKKIIIQVTNWAIGKRWA